MDDGSSLVSHWAALRNGLSRLVRRFDPTIGFRVFQEGLCAQKNAWFRKTLRVIDEPGILKKNNGRFAISIELQIDQQALYRELANVAWNLIIRIHSSLCLNRSPDLCFERLNVDRVGVVISQQSLRFD